MFGLNLASAAQQRVEDYTITPSISAIYTFFSQVLAVDGDCAVVTAHQTPAGSNISHTIYFLKLEDGRWSVESTSVHLPGGGATISLRHAVIEGDVVVAVGTFIEAGVDPFQLLYTFHRKDGGGWEFESSMRVPRVLGYNSATGVRLKGGLLTFSNRHRLMTYERVNGAWERRPDANLNPSLAGSPDPFFLRRQTRSEDELLVWVDSSVSPTLGWQRYTRRNNRWSFSQAIGNPQPPQAGVTYYPSDGSDVDAGWFMYGAHPKNAGVGLVIVMKENAVTGDYEYHSTLQPANSIPGGANGRDQFGASLDLDGVRGRLIVGASKSGRPIGGIAGRAYLYEYNEATDSWDQIERISYSGNTQHTPDTYIDFGRHVALWGNGALVSSPVAPGDDGTVAVGRLHVFEDSFGTSFCAGTATPSAPEAELSVSGSNVLPHAGGLLGGDGLPPQAPFTVLLSSSSASVPLPGGSGESFCVGGPRTNTGGLRISEADGSAVVGFDLNDPGLAGALVGDHRYVQVWFQMPPSTGQPVGLTNAIDVRFE